MRLLFVLSSMVVVSACATAGPTTDSVRVAVADQEVAACSHVGDVRGDHNLYGGAMVQIAINDATAQIKNQTAKLGGNTVLITSSVAHWAGANMSGKAYRC